MVGTPGHSPCGRRLPDGPADREAGTGPHAASPGNRAAQEGIRPGRRGPQPRSRPTRKASIRKYMLQQQALSHSVQSSTLADVLERVLDKGIVIAGDIRVKLVDIELLSIQIRLVICSVDKAKEMGTDWWVNNPIFRQDKRQEIAAASLTSLEARMATLEDTLSKVAASSPLPLRTG